MLIKKSNPFGRL